MSELPDKNLSMFNSIKLYGGSVLEWLFGCIIVT